MSDSENNDVAFVGPIASWFVLIDDLLQNQTDSKHKYCLHKASSIYKCNLTVYVCLRDDLRTQKPHIGPLYRRVYVSAGAVIRSLENQFRGQKSTHWRNNLAWLYCIMYMQYVSMFLT